MPAFGSTINPALGRVDYSAYTQGAAQGAAQIGQGLQQLGAGIGAAVQEYKKKEEEKQQDEYIAGVLAKNPQFAQKFGVDPNDKGALKAVTKAVGRGALVNGLMSYTQQEEAKAKNERIGRLASFMAENNGAVPRDVASTIKADEYMTALGMAQSYRTNEAGIGKTIAETNVLNAGKPEKDKSIWGVSYDAFKDTIRSQYGREPTAEETSNFAKQYQQQSHAPTIINTAENKGLGAAETEIGKEVGARYNAIAESANAAERKLELLDKVKSLYNSGAYTGTGASLITTLSNIAVGLGIDVPSNASQNEIEQLLQEEALRSTREMYKGTGSISNLEGSKGEKIVANLSRTPEGNIQILKWQSANAPLLRAANDLKIKLRKEKKEPEEIVDAVDAFIRKGYRKIDDFSESSIKKKGDESAVYDIVTGGKSMSPSSTKGNVIDLGSGWSMTTPVSATIK